MFTSPSCFVRACGAGSRARDCVTMNDINYYCQFETPIGMLLLVGDEHHLRQVGLQAGTHPTSISSDWIESERPFAMAIGQLRQYFAGTRTTFELPLAPHGTDFQHAVWRELQNIPYGHTLSYGELARALGNARASRAVGLANGANPLPVIVPCHRVIGADGSLTGFGGGLAIKRALLGLERAECVQDLFSHQ
jgi:methylated-DNA-[protein]-cysteine S-methyltransferase